jgi:hypothetical protein
MLTRAHAKPRTICTTATPGRQRIRLGAGLPRDLYRLRVTAVDAAGNRSRPAAISFTVR